LAAAAFNREFGLGYWANGLSSWWLQRKDSIGAGLERLHLFPSLTARWSSENASLTGWSDFVDKAVASAATDPQSDNFASLLLGEAPDAATKAGATAQLLDAIFAGTDTLTATLSLAGYILSSSSPVMRDAIAAIRDELPPQPWRLQDLESLPWLGATVRELLRITDANPHLLERVIPSPPPGDLHPALATLPPSSRVGVAGYVVHRDPQAYGPDPAAFDARRWLPTSHPAHHHASPTVAADDLSTYWMAFGRSPRACIAQTFAQAVAVAFVATFVERYDGVRKGPDDLVEAHWRDCFNKVLVGEGRVPVVLRRRSRAKV
jgi:cytochrome P450